MTGSNSLELRKAADVAHTRGRKTLQWVCDWVFCGNQCVVERYGEVVVCDVMFEVGIVARAHILGAGESVGKAPLQCCESSSSRNYDSRFVLYQGNERPLNRVSFSCNRDKGCAIDMLCHQPKFINHTRQADDCCFGIFISVTCAYFLSPPTFELKKLTRSAKFPLLYQIHDISCLAA
jgi:hypothetical protein